MRRPRFFYSPDGVTSAHSSEAALDQTFGPLSGIRPDLAAVEAKEKGNQKAGAAPVLALEIDRPVLDSERPPPKVDGDTKEETPEAARTAPPAEGDKADGSDDQSPDEEAAALDALLAKYQGKPRSMAQAIREIRSLQTRTAEEKKEIEDRLEAAATVLDSDYDVVDGKFVLKSDVAAKALRSQRGNGSNPLRMPTEAEVRSQVEAQFKEKGLDMVEEEQLPAFMAKMKPLIDQTVNERTTALKTQIETQRAGMAVAVGDIVNRHMAAHPDHKDLLPALDTFYAGIPEEARTIAFLENWFPFERVAELLHMERSVKTMVKDAYTLGKKARGQAATVTEAGSPGRSRPAPTNGRGNSSDVVKDLKAGVMRGSGLPSIDELFAK